MGLNKTKALLRSKVYFPLMDQLVERIVGLCIPCQTVTQTHKKPPLIIQPLPAHVWETVNVDYLGPFPNGYYLFVIVDQRSKYPAVEFLRNTSMNSLRPALENLFSVYGIPDNLISDNRLPFFSREFYEFLLETGVNHKCITPLWPQANGQAERFMPSLTKIAKTAILERKDWKIETYKFLAAYRNTPHPSTKVAPSDMMFNRKVRYTIPDIDRTINVDEINTKAERNNRLSKLRSKDYFDKRCNTNDMTLDIGDRVIVIQPKRNKTTPTFEPVSYRVTHINGTKVTAESETGHRIVTRNISFFKRIPTNAQFPTHITTTDSDSDDDTYSRQDTSTANQHIHRPLRQTTCRILA